MARRSFGGGTADYLELGNGRRVAGTVTFWTAAVGGAQVTDLLVSGAPATSVASDVYGFLPEFQGPDEVTKLYGDAGGGRRVVFEAHDDTLPTDAQVDAGIVRAGAVRAFPVVPPVVSASANRLAIQAALDAAAVAGGGRVVLSPGAVYTVDAVVHPTDSTLAVCLMLDSGVHLDMNGATIKLRDAQPVPSGVVGSLLDTAQANLMIVSVRRPRSNALTSHQNITVRDGIIDGNAAAQTLVQADGLWLNRVRSAWVVNVKAINVPGHASAQPGETFAFDVNNCTDVHFLGCEAACTDGSNTASGFSANNSTGVSWTDCIARDMKYGMGFTSWQSGVLSYANCHAYGNGGYGFNTERSEGVTYANCHGGIRSAPVASAQPGPFWTSVGQQKGNGFGGFCVHGASNVDLVACQGFYNVGAGLTVKDNTGAAPTVISNRVRVIGGEFGFNTRGLDVASTATNVSLLGHIDSHDNTAVDLVPVGPADIVTAGVAGAPWHHYRNLNDSAGMRFNVVRSNGTGAPTGFGYRWYVGGTLGLTITTGVDVVAGRSLRPAQYATASRPGASSVGAGAHVFDTTLNKPIWSDGTNWRDAAGTIV